MKRLLLFFFLTGITAVSVAQMRATVLLIDDVTVIDVKGGQALPHRCVLVRGFVVAADKRVKPLHSVDQPLRQQKIQRAVNRGRLAAAGFGAQPVQQRIGAHRLAGLQDQTKHVASLRSKPHAASRTLGLGTRQALAERVGILFGVGVLDQDWDSRTATMPQMGIEREPCYVIA